MAERPAGIIEGSGRQGEPKSLDQMVSVRFDVPTLRALRMFTEKTGRSFSDVIRTAVWDYVEENSDVPLRGTPLCAVSVPGQSDTEGAE